MGHLVTISLVWSKIIEVFFLGAKLSAPFISLLTVNVTLNTPQNQHGTEINYS